MEEETTATIENIEQVNKGERLKIDEGKLKSLTAIRDASIQIRNAIGDLEIRKQELFVQHIGIKQKMEKEAEAALLEAGVSPETIKEYRIDLKTGEFSR